MTGCHRLDLEWAIFRVDPAFGDERNPGEFDIAATGFAFRADPFDGVSLAIGRRTDDENPKLARGIAQDEVHDLAVSADVEGADEDIRPRFNKPPLQMPANGGWDVVANEDGHGEEN